MQAALCDLFCFLIGYLPALCAGAARQDRSIRAERQAVDNSGLFGGGTLPCIINSLYGSVGNRDGQDFVPIYPADMDLTVLLNGGNFAAIRA